MKPPKARKALQEVSDTILKARTRDDCSILFMYDPARFRQNAKHARKSREPLNSRRMKSRTALLHYLEEPRTLREIRGWMRGGRKYAKRKISRMAAQGKVTGKNGLYWADSSSPS